MINPAECEPAKNAINELYIRDEVELQYGFKKPRELESDLALARCVMCHYIRGEQCTAEDLYDCLRSEGFFAADTAISLSRLHQGPMRGVTPNGLINFFSLPNRLLPQEKQRRSKIGAWLVRNFGARESLDSRLLVSPTDTLKQSIQL